MITLMITSLVLGALYGAFEDGLLRFNYPSHSRFPIRGIDVSHHQGDIHWPSVKDEGVHFAFIKATEGGDFVDNQFHINWRNAYRAGIVRGAYHYFSFCKPGKMQARNFLNTVPQEANTLPPVIDLEFDRHCNKNADPSVLAREVAAFAALTHLWISMCFVDPSKFLRTSKNMLFLFKVGFYGATWMTSGLLTSF